jgi:hypothetical protein
MTNKTWLDETDAMISDIENDLAALMERANQLEANLMHMKSARDYYIKAKALRVANSQPSDRKYEEYTKLSHTQIILQWGKKHDGIVKSIEVLPIFRKKMPNPKHAQGALSSTIKRLKDQGKVKRINSGTYQLIEPIPTTSTTPEPKKETQDTPQDTDVPSNGHNKLSALNLF